MKDKALQTIIDGIEAHVSSREDVPDLVKLLLNLVEKLVEKTDKLEEETQQLKNEINKLKGETAPPKIAKANNG